MDNFSPFQRRLWAGRHLLLYLFMANRDLENLHSSSRFRRSLLNLSSVGTPMTVANFKTLLLTYFPSIHSPRFVRLDEDSRVGQVLCLSTVFDEFSQSRPSAALRDLLRQLISFIIAQRESEYHAWKDVVLRCVLGDFLTVFLRLLPFLLANN